AWERTFRIGRHTGVPIEPRSLVAAYGPATRALTLWISSQVPHMMQAIVSDLFGLPEQRVRVVAPDVGGSFGIKIHVYQDDLAACALALVLGRPVKWVGTRRESFLADIHAREQTVAIEVAADADETLLLRAGYEDLRREQGRARAAGRAVGIGLACFVELTGPGAQFYGIGGAPISGQEGTTVRLEPSGAVTVLTGLTDQGQGTRTALAQIVADELGVPVESVAVVSGDTAVVPYGGGTWASRGMPIGGSATLLAGKALRERVTRVAAALLAAHAADVELGGGRATVRGTDKALALGDLARTVHFRSNQLRGVEPRLG